MSYQNDMSLHAIYINCFSPRKTFKNKTNKRIVQQVLKKMFIVYLFLILFCNYFYVWNYQALILALGSTLLI